MTAPDFPALVAQARARLDEIERNATEVKQMVDCSSDLGVRPWWTPDDALRVVQWGRGVLERHASRRTICNGHAPLASTEEWPCPDVRAVLAFLLPGSVTA